MKTVTISEHEYRILKATQSVMDPDGCFDKEEFKEYYDDVTIPKPPVVKVDKEYKEDDEVTIDGVDYHYCYGVLRSFVKKDGLYHQGAKPHIRCPQCYGHSFEVNYGDWECLALCPCGHEMSVYSG